MTLAIQLVQSFGVVLGVLWIGLAIARALPGDPPDYLRMPKR